MPRSPARTSPLGFTLIELLIVVAIVSILVGISVPGLTRARQAGNETSALGSLRAITSAQVSFAATCGHDFYSPTLEQLGIPPPTGTAFLSPDLAVSDPVVKSGYTFTMSGTPAGNSPASCNGLEPNATTTGYHVTADPLSDTGSRHFGTNTTATIWQHTAALELADEGAPAAGTPFK